MVTDIYLASDWLNVEESMATDLVTFDSLQNYADTRSYLSFIFYQRTPK